jgi:hypothetical protein
MSSPGRRTRAMWVRLAVVILIGGGAAAYLWVRGTPLTLSEAKIRAMIDGKELIGLPMAKAAERLQHHAGYVEDGLSILEFRQIPGWSAGPVVLDIKEGRVQDVYFQREHKETE